MTSKTKALTVTLTEFAALVDRSLPTVQTMIRDGLPTLGKRGREHRVEVGPAVQWVIHHIEARVEEELDSAIGNPELVQARVHKIKAETKALELKLARQRGELWPRDQIVAEAQTIVKGWVAKVRMLPRRARLAGALTTAEQEAALAAICRELLEEISCWKTTADVTRAINESTA